MGIQEDSLQTPCYSATENHAKYMRTHYLFLAFKYDHWNHFEMHVVCMVRSNEMYYNNIADTL